MVDVVVGERMMKFQAMQLFIREFHEILNIMRNYLPILSIENFTGNSKYQFYLKFQISHLFTENSRHSQQARKAVPSQAGGVFFNGTFINKLTQP